jgi:F1F0 ATPase subunit 2
MVPRDLLIWALSFVCGAALGTFYFLGLWWSLKRLPGKSRPRLWLGASYALRTSLVLAGFWLALRADVPSFLAMLCGFFLMRQVVLRRVVLKKDGSSHARQSG